LPATAKTPGVRLWRRYEFSKKSVGCSGGGRSARLVRLADAFEQKTIRLK